MSLGVEDEGVVRTITFDDPRTRNSLSSDTIRELLEALRATFLDDAVRVVVLTGAGDDFSSGANLGRLGSGGGHPLTRMWVTGDVALALQNSPKPTIARVRGVVVGAASNFALGCDFVVADTTTRFSEIFARRGLSLDGGGSWLLPRAVGLLQARRLAMLGEVLDAAEARELGLITYLVEPDELDAKVTDLAERLAAGPPVALAQTRRALNRGWSMSLEDVVELEAAGQTVNFATDAPEAMRAFLSRDTPRFDGGWHIDAPPARAEPAPQTTPPRSTP